MADHLPECLPVYQVTVGCICPDLRACEQRVLDAAREAVARTCGHTKYEGCLPCAHDDALAAIDALRGEQ